MHIHMLIPSLESGGAQKVAVSLINEWVKNHTVTLVLFNNLIEYHVDERINIVVLNVKRSGLRFKTGIETVTAVRKLRKYIRGRKEHLTFFGILESSNIVLSIIKKMMGKRIYAIGGSHTNVLRYGLYCRFFRIYRYLDKLVTVSSPMMKFYRETGVRDSCINFIPNPVDIELVRKQSEEELSEDLINILDKGRIILGAGRLVKVKNFELLIRAFGEFAGRNREFMLVILGEGEERENLEELISELKLNGRVFLPGFSSNPYVWMKNSDFFVLSSDYEGWPNVLIEALAIGTPIISTNCVSGPSEILKNGELGKLVPVGDVDAMAKAFTESIDVAGTISEEDNWKVDIVAEKYLELVNEVKE